MIEESIHEIPLKDENTIIYTKEFPGPLSTRPDAKTHLEELIQLRILTQFKSHIVLRLSSKGSQTDTLSSYVTIANSMNRQNGNTTCTLMCRTCFMTFMDLNGSQKSISAKDTIKFQSEKRIDIKLP